MDVAVMDRLEDILSSCEYNGGGIDTLLENVLLSAGSIVKSVQQGNGKLPGNSSDLRTKSIPISTININKSVLIISFIANTETYASTAWAALLEDKIDITYINTINSTKNEYSIGYTWSVLEFY